jgi:Flp pilus assembly protein TadG
MMRILKPLLRNERGSSAVEFALLAPLFFALMFGVVEVGIYMQNYNAVKSLASDAARFAAVEYQKNNKITETTLEENIHSMGLGSPYLLSPDRLTVEVVEVTPSPVDGARQFTLTLTYDLPDFVGGTSVDDVTLDYSREIFVLA